MQCSAWRPTSSASTSVRPASSRTRWNSCGPSPSRTPVHSDVYGFIRSAVEERGSSWSMTSRSRHSGSTFSIPISVITTRAGSVVHMRPLPSDSTTPTVPVSAIAKLAPLTRHGHGEELRAQVAPGGLGDPRGLEAQLLRRGDGALEQVGDLRPVAVDGRHEDVRLLVVAELDDELRQIGLDRADAAQRERLVEPDLVRRERLDLDHLVAAVRAREAGDDGVRLGAVARPVDRPAGRRHALLQPLELLGQRRHRPRLDRRARVAQRLPVGQLRRPRARAWPGSPSSPCRGCGAAARPAASRPPRPPAKPAGGLTLLRRQDLGQVHRPHAGPLAPQRAADVHQARVVHRRADLGARVEHAPQLVAQHGHRRVGVLDRERAAEAAALVGASPSSTRSIPRTARSSRCGRSPTCSARTEWQVGCSVTRCGNDAPTSSTPSTSTRNSVSSYTGGPSAQPLAHEARRTTRRARRPPRHRRTRARSARAAPRRVLVARVAVHLAAAGLLRAGTPPRSRAARAARPSRVRCPGTACR